MRRNVQGCLIVLLFATSFTACKKITPPEQAKSPSEQVANPKHFERDSRIAYCVSKHDFRTDLSNEFDYDISVNHWKTADSIRGFSEWKLTVIDKVTGQFTDSICLGSESYYEFVGNDRNRIRSLVTNTTDGFELHDNDQGDLIIADLNFDRKEDIALVRKSWGNGGPIYDFYIQGKHGQFSRDHYLSEIVMSFPEEINQAQRTIRTRTHANVMGAVIETYKFVGGKGQWRFVRRQYDLCCGPNGENRISDSLSWPREWM